MRSVAQGLAEGAGMFGLHRIGTEAALLEDSADVGPEDPFASSRLARALDGVIEEIRRIAPTS